VLFASTSFSAFWHFFFISILDTKFIRVPRPFKRRGRHLLCDLRRGFILQAKKLQHKLSKEKMDTYIYTFWSDFAFTPYIPRAFRRNLCVKF